MTSNNTASKILHKNTKSPEALHKARIQDDHTKYKRKIASIDMSSLNNFTDEYATLTRNTFELVEQMGNRQPLVK